MTQPQHRQCVGPGLSTHGRCLELKTLYDIKKKKETAQKQAQARDRNEARKKKQAKGMFGC